MPLAIGKFITDNLLGKVFGIVDKVIKDKDAAEKLKAEITTMHVDAKLEELKIRTKDRQGARALYSTTNSVQRLYAIIFLVGYIAVSFALLGIVFFPDQMPPAEDWEVSMIGTVFGALSTKVSTITDFFFGSSESNSKK